MKKTALVLLLALLSTGSRAELISKTNVSGYPYYVFESQTFERLTKYTESELTTGPNDQQAFLDVQAAWDAQEWLDLGTYSFSGYFNAFGRAESMMEFWPYTPYQFFANREGREYTLVIDLSQFDHSTALRARLEWYAPARRLSEGTPDIHTPLPSEDVDLSQELLLGATNLVIKTIMPRWETWSEWQAGNQEEQDWLFWEPPWPTVFVWMVTQDIQPEAVRPQWPLARTRDPINTINGNVSYDTTDIAVPTPGIPLIFSRAYNSSDVRTGGPIGPRWSHSYFWTLSQTNTTFDGQQTSWKVIRTGDGADYRFKVDGGNYEPPFDVNWQLAAAGNGYTLTIPPATEYHFTSNGILSSIADGWGNTVTLTYTNGTELVRAEHSTGLALEFGYDGGKLTSATSPDANLSMSYAYNADGDLTNATRTVAGIAEVTTYGYDASTNHFLTLRVNPNGDTFSYTYETNNGALTSRGASMTLNTNWYTHALVYSNDWNRTFVTYERGDIEQTFAYDINPLINRVAGIDSPGRSESFGYDDFGNITNRTLTDTATGEPLITVMAYDDAHNVTNEATGYGAPSARLWHYTWNTNLQRIASVTDPEGSTVEYDYTSAGALAQTRQFPAAGVPLTASYGYTTNGLLAAVTNANGHWVQYSQDGNGYLSAVAPQAGPTITYSNSLLGHVEQIILPGSSGQRVTEFNVNPLGQILGIGYPDSTSESMAYDPLGNMTAHTNAEGSVTTFDYLPARTLSKIVHTGWDGLTVTNRFNYDRQFNTLAVIDALGRNVESYALDTQDRPTTITNVEGQTMSIAYGVGQLVKSVTRFDGTTVSNAYDGDARLDAVHYPDATLDYGYYDNGLLKSAANALGTVSNQYDGANRLTASEVTLDGLTAEVAYGLDGVGNATNTTATVAGKTLGVARTFDAAERLSTLSASGEIASPLSFAYTHNSYNGLVATVTNGTTGGRVEYEYTDMDRLASVAWKDDQGGTVRSFTYSYSPAGMVTNITLESGERLVYTYDSLQRLTSEKRLSATGTTLREESFTYDAVGNRMAKTLDGTTVTYSYPYGSQGNRLASWSASSTDQFEVGRRWDVAGHSSETIGTNDRFGALWVSNTVAVTPEVSGTNFTAAAFLLGSGTQQVVAAIRDEAGNMGYATNTVTTRIVTNAVYGYNAAGCVTSIVYRGISYPERTIGLEWNGQYQLTAVRENGSLAESYGYDALGRRAWISDGTTTNRMVYDGQHLAAEVDANGDLVRRYIAGPGIDNMLGMVSYENGETNTFFFVTDHLGTVHAVLDDSGAVVESYEFDAWGRVLAVCDADGKALSESAIGNRILFHGREFSWASGLYFFRARSYDPCLGRWTGKDPIGIRGGANQYVAFNNNPIAFVDPGGCSWLRGIGYGLAGLAVGVVVGAVVVATAPAWAVVALGVTASAAGGFMTGVNTVEYVTGRTYISGQELSWDERTTRGGQVLVDAATLGISGTRWFRTGAAADMDWVNMSPRQRLAHSRGLMTVADDLNANLSGIPPSQRGIALGDWRPQNLGKTWSSGADSALRSAFPYALTGAGIGTRAAGAAMYLQDTTTQ